MFRLTLLLLITIALTAHDDPDFATAHAAASADCRHAYGVALIYAEVATELAKLKEPERAAAGFATAQAAILRIQQPLLRDYAWARLANAAAAAGNDANAEAAFANIVDTRLRAHATWKLVNKMGKAGRTAEAGERLDALHLAIVSAVQEPGERAALLAETGGSYRFVDPARGAPLVREALRLADAVHDPFDGAVLRNLIGACLVDVGEVELARTVFAQAAEQAAMITDASGRAHHLAMLGGERAEKGLRDEAVTALDEALAAARQLPDGEDRWDVTSEIARNYSQAHRFAPARAVADEIPDAYHRAEAWIRIAKNEARTDHAADARQLLARITELAPSIADPFLRGIVRRKVASEWVTLGERDLAIAQLDLALADCPAHP